MRIKRALDMYCKRVLSADVAVPPARPVLLSTDDDAMDDALSGLMLAEHSFVSDTPDPVSRDELTVINGSPAPVHPLPSLLGTPATSTLWDFVDTSDFPADELEKKLRMHTETTQKILDNHSGLSDRASTASDASMGSALDDDAVTTAFEMLKKMENTACHLSAMHFKDLQTMVRRRTARTHSATWTVAPLDAPLTQYRLLWRVVCTGGGDEHGLL